MMSCSTTIQLAGALWNSQPHDVTEITRPAGSWSAFSLRIEGSCRGRGSVEERTLFRQTSPGSIPQPNQFDRIRKQVEIVWAVIAKNTGLDGQRHFYAT